MPTTRRAHLTRFLDSLPEPTDADLADIERDTALAPGSDIDRMAALLAGIDTRVGADVAAVVL